MVWTNKLGSYRSLTAKKGFMAALSGWRFAEADRKVTQENPDVRP
jgi:hypothetical protein